MDHFGMWGIIPPVLTIALAFITKDVIVSLFLGILSGCIIVAGGNPAAALMRLTDLLAGSLADGWNIRIFLFCGLLGALVGMLSKTGAAQAFGLWMSKKLKNKTASQFATFIFGLIVFIDDYFNSLTVGTVMRPINDQHKVPRAKLAYILDSTAAPVCILAPVSSWVVTVMSIVRNSEGFGKLGMSDFEFFIRAIPYNLYALTTILMILVIIFFKSDFGAMKKSEDLAKTSGLLWNEEVYGVISGDIPEEQTTRAKPLDMLLPILLLIFPRRFVDQCHRRLHNYQYITSSRIDESPRRFYQYRFILCAFLCHYLYLSRYIPLLSCTSPYESKRSKRGCPRRYKIYGSCPYYLDDGMVNRSGHTLIPYRRRFRTGTLSFRTGCKQLFPVMDTSRYRLCVVSGYCICNRHELGYVRYYDSDYYADCRRVNGKRRIGAKYRVQCCLYLYFSRSRRSRFRRPCISDFRHNDFIFHGSCLPAFGARRNTNALRAFCRNVLVSRFYHRRNLYEYSFRMARRFSGIYRWHHSFTEDNGCKSRIGIWLLKYALKKLFFLY